MIEYDLDKEHSILHVQPKSPLEQDDFVNLAKAVDPYIEATGGLAGLIIEAPAFPGWESFGAMVTHFRFVRDHHKRVKRIAVVTDSSLGNVAERLASHFVSAEIRHFPAGQAQAARQWISPQERMGSYHTVIVGTDGSDSSLRAVDRAGAIAAWDGTKLIVASAYLPTHDDTRAEDALKDESYKVVGAAPIYAILREAHDRAKAAGAKDIEERSIVAAPVDALVHLADEVNADLLVVGNVGMNSIAGRLLGSVPATIAHRAKCDVLIVHTMG